MSAVASSDAPASAQTSARTILFAVLTLAAGIIVARALGVLPDWLHRMPRWMVPPIEQALDAAFAFAQNDLGLIHVTRGIAGILEYALDTAANLLYGKRRWPNFDAVPWSAITAGMTVLAWHLGGWRLALLAGGTLVWTAVMGQWTSAMETMSVLIVSAPLSVALGLAIGIAAWKWNRVDRALRPLLSVLQTLPFFTYLLPAVIFFKVGPTAGAVATLIFSLPPMILMTTVGLNKVSPGVVEAGEMSGCNRWQMLVHVYLPTARNEILVGVNQVIMLCLAMVVLAAFIGMPGLGADLLNMMAGFRLGWSLEIGITIVLLAITLDRLSKVWAQRLPTRFERGTPVWRRHAALLIGLAAVAAFWLVAQLVPYLQEVGYRQSLSQGRVLDASIKEFLALDGVRAVTGSIRRFVNVSVLIPFRDGLLWLPTSAFILLVAAWASWIGGLRSGLVAGLFFSLVALSGWWNEAVITLYMVLAAVLLASLIGLPLGIVAARSEKASARVLVACDTAQTFPSFVYILPAIMLFGVSDVSVVLSILIFTAVPLCRYTIEGLRRVPAETVESSDMSGATRWQKLVKVQLPLALPTLAIGFNQAIMFAFFMVIIAAFIGTQGLGQELQRTLSGAQLGRNLVLGFCVSLMALSFSTAILAWSNRRARALGLA